MKPVPPSLTLGLTAALCILLAWQWHREGRLRGISAAQAAAIQQLTAETEDATARLKSADAEILTLTGALSGLRANSVSPEEHAQTQETLRRLKESVEQQNALLLQQNEALARANEATLQANETIRKLTADRDAAARRLNDLTARYNKLLKP